MLSVRENNLAKFYDNILAGRIAGSRIRYENDPKLSILVAKTATSQEKVRNRLLQTKE